MSASEWDNFCKKKCLSKRGGRVNFLQVGTANVLNAIDYYTPTAIMLAKYVTHMNTQLPGGICYASLEVGLVYEIPTHLH